MNYMNMVCNDDGMFDVHIDNWVINTNHSSFTDLVETMNEWMHVNIISGVDEIKEWQLPTLAESLGGKARPMTLNERIDKAKVIKENQKISERWAERDPQNVR